MTKNKSDDPLWKAYTRGLKPLEAAVRHKTHVVKVTRKKTETQKNAIEMPLPMAPSSPVTEDKFVARTGLPLERRREKAIRDGEVEIEAKLDLHGYTQIEAFEALAQFMRAQIALKRRCVLIVTGKGKEGQGVLRTHLRGWLNRLPEAASILALRPASPKHGGEGAVYILLRRART